MTTADTALQQQQQAQTAQQGIQAVQTIPLTNTHGSNIPAVYTQNYAQQELDKFPKITPPSVDNIHKNMWISSGMVGLMAALATGNAAGGIVAGMWAAVAVHDGGYALRERGKYVRQLQEDGYSYPAILKWYKSGDNKDLETEHGQMEQDKRQDNQQLNENARFNAGQANSAEQARLGREFQGQEAALNRNQQWSIANQAHLDRQDTAAAAGRAEERADARLDKQQQQQFDSEMKKAIDGPKQKLQNAIVAEQAYGQLKDYINQGRRDLIPGAFNNLNHALARVQVGGNATLTDDQVQHATGLLSYADKKANDLGILVNGVPSVDWMSSVGRQIKDDKYNESEAITQVGRQAYQNLVDSGIEPSKAHHMVVRGLVGTATGAADLDGKGAGGVVEQPAGQTAQPQQAYPDGTVIKNPKTGQRMVMKNGKWEDL